VHLQADILINDTEQPDLGIPLDVPTEGEHDPLRWNTLVGGGGAAAGNPCVQECLAEAVLLPTGHVDDEGYFALPEEITYAFGKNGSCVSPFVKNGRCLFKEFPEGCGLYDTEGNKILSSDDWKRAFAQGTLPQDRLDKVCHVMPYRNHELLQLVGRTCVAVVYDSDVNMDYVKVYANLQGERYGLFTFEVLGTPLCDCGDKAPTCPPLVGVTSSDGLELPGDIPESTSSTSLYDLWIKALPPQDPGLGCSLFVRDHEPDSIQITRASLRNGTLTIRGESKFSPGAIMTVSIGAKNGKDNNPDAGFVLEAQMTYYPATNRYEYVLPNAPSHLRGRRVMISTNEGGAYSTLIP